MRRYQSEELRYLGLELVSPAADVTIRRPREKTLMAKTEDLLIDVVVDEGCSWDLIPLDLDQLPRRNVKGLQSPPKNLSHAENELPLVGKQAKVEQGGQIPHTKPFDKRVNKSCRLSSKERFEEWLDGLIPGSPSSQVSTLPHSEDPPPPPDVDDGDQKPCQLDVITTVGDSPMASTMEYAACGACGMVSRDGGVRTGELVIRDGREKKIRDWGVQTDITGCFVVL
jgi:hypothetical protein